MLAVLRAHPNAADGLPPYDLAAYLTESRLCVDWYRPAAIPSGRDDPAASIQFDDLLSQALSRLPAAPTVCTLRDYHAENLIWLPDRSGAARVGLLDYQDALAGHPAYDLVSLLEDARRDTSAQLQASLKARYCDLTGQTMADLDIACAILGAQRNLKILGIFARLWIRDGKPAYLDLLPRVWGHLGRDLAHPALAPLADWVVKNLPAPDAAVRDRLRAAR